MTSLWIQVQAQVNNEDVAVAEPKQEGSLGRVELDRLGSLRDSTQISLLSLTPPKPLAPLPLRCLSSIAFRFNFTIAFRFNYLSPRTDSIVSVCRITQEELQSTEKRCTLRVICVHYTRLTRV